MERPNRADIRPERFYMLFAGGPFCNRVFVGTEVYSFRRLDMYMNVGDLMLAQHLVFDVFADFMAFGNA
jgi:hypothetical protein